MYSLKENIQYYSVSVCLFVIGFFNRTKNRCLSQRLYEAAEEYNTRPGTMNYDIMD